MLPALMGAGAAASMAMQLFPPLQEALSQSTFKIYPNRIPNIAESIQLLYLGVIDEQEFLSISRANGFDEKYAQNLVQGQRKYLTEIDIINSWRRGFINEETLNEYFNALHYSSADKEIIKRVSEYFPSPADLVRFAVREVYSPEIAQQFGQFEDLPEKFISESYKAGLPTDQARNYWAAHWELPSATMGFEMLHRGVIDEQTLNRLLRALDVMPFWRDKITAISYNPLTRVDVRRMYSLGVIDREMVKRSYLDLGYNDNNAELMTEFTVKNESKEDLGLTKEVFLNAFKKDIIDDGTCVEGLVSLGYSDDAIALIMQIATYEKIDQITSMMVENITTSYQTGDITYDQMVTALNSLDLPAIFIQSVINKINIKSAIKTKVPSKEDADRWLKNQVIDEKEYIALLVRLGYAEHDRNLYLSEISHTTDTHKKKYLSVAVYQRWLDSGIMSASAFTDTLLAQGYQVIDIQLLIQESQSKQQ